MSIGWQRARRRAAIDEEVRQIILATLAEAKLRIQWADPAPSTRLTYLGGKRRAIGLLRKMAEELQR